MDAVGAANPDIVIVVNRHGASVDAGYTGVIDDAFVVGSADATVGVGSSNPTAWPGSDIG